MAIVQRFFPQDLRNTAVAADGNRKSYTAVLLKWWRAVAPFTLLALILLFAAVPQWAQVAQLAGSNVVPLEGPGAGTDTVLLYASGLQGTATTTAMFSIDAEWITLLTTVTGSDAINIQNGPNRLRFQYAANTGSTRTGHIGLQLADGSPGVTITVTQAGTGFAPAGPVSLITSITGPEGIDVDSEGNLYITDVSGSNLFVWTSATQQLSGIATGLSGLFVDVAVDAAGDVFALENTSDSKFGTQVEQIRAAPGHTLPPANFVFSSEANKYEFPMGLCVDPAGQNLYVTTVDVSNKCLIDQFGTVYELDSTDANENIGSFASPPTNAEYQFPPNGQLFFPTTTGVDPCGNPQVGVSGSLYGLFKDGSGFIYFVDQNGTRINRYDPTTPWYTCTVNSNGGIITYPSYTSFTTVTNLIFPAYYAAADTVGNIYLSEMAFSLVQEIPRAYLSSVGPFNEPVGGGTDTIQILPAAQSLTGVFAPVSSNTAWLNVTSVANGVVTFSFSPNPGPSRTATINVLGVPIQVVQGESQVPAAMTIVSGNNQQAAVGGFPFATNLLVKVTNQWGDAAANVPVTFSSPSQNISVTTDQRGYGATNGVTAYAVGPISVTASIAGGISQTFALTGVPSGVSVVSGSNQQQHYTGLFGLPMKVQVFGTSGQPVAGVPVTFSAPTSGASGTFLAGNGTTLTVNTLNDGTATTFAAFQANTALGSYVVTASISGAPGIAASSCAFNLTNFGILQELVGNESAFVNNAYPTPLSLRVVDGNGNPSANVGVNFVVGLGGGNGTGAVFPDGTSSNNVVTGADGIATAPPMTATATAGTFTASAFVNNLPSGGSLTAGWTLTNLPSTILEGALQTGLTTRTLTQPVIVQASANATAGTMVFTVVPGSSGAGGSFNGQNSVTTSLDSQGYGNSPLLTANSTPGTFTVTAYDGVTTVQSTITTTPCLNPNNPSVPVTTTADYNPQYPATIITGSLRYVLANACAGSNIDLTQLSGIINLQSRLRIDDNMTITGPGPGTLAIDGGTAMRLFFIGNGLVTISNLTLQNGLAQGGGSVFGGGGAGMGGAIFMEGGDVTLTNVTFNGNKALGGGSGVATQCTTNCLYGGGGFTGFAGNGVSPELGGTSGDLFGVPGTSNGASGGIGAGGAGTGVFPADTSANGGNGGFGAGGGTGRYTEGVTSSGNGGFGGGGAGGNYGCPTLGPLCWQVVPGTGGYGAGNGYDPGDTVYNGFGGSGAGFGGAIFEYAGQLTLNGVQFLNNSAVGGTVAGLSGQPTVVGQGKGGAVFIYNGANLINNGSTFGTNGTNNVAPAAGLPGNGNSAAPYTNGATCPGLDTVDICGIFGNTSAVTVTITVPTGLTFLINDVNYSGSQTLSLPQGQYTLVAPSPQAPGGGSQLAFASWSDGGAASHAITVGPAGLSITGTFVTQYLLSISAGAGGLTVPASSGYYNAGSAVSLNAAPNVGSAFTNWTGPVAAAGSAATTVTMSAPQTVTANFVAMQQVNVTVPQGVSFTLNGVNYSGPQFVPLAPGQYALSTTSPQSAAIGGEQVVFSSWSDGGGLSHTITVGSSALSISGTFSTQYQLTANAGSGGAISMVTGFYSSGTVVNVTAYPSAESVFHNWTGTVASPSLATTTVTVNQPTTVTANFWPAPYFCVAAPPNLTAWWKAENNFNDVTGAYNATADGDVSFAPGRVGNAFSFDGTQSPAVSVPAGVFPPQPGTGAFSFEAWFQTSGGNGGVILGQQAVAPYAAASAGWSPAIYVGTDGNLYVEMFYNGGINQSVGPVLVNDNQWHHIAVTYDGSSEIAYLDGANIGQALSYTQVANGSPLSYQLGTGYTSNWPATNGGWYTFNGLIDEATVYSRALTAAEVLGIAQAGSYGKCTGSTEVQVALTGGSNPSVYGQPVTFTATISATSSGTLSGIVNWSSYTGCADSTLSGNPATATCTTTFLPVGSDQVTLFYQGDSGHSSSSASISQTVNQPVAPLPSMISVGSSRNPSNSAQTITFIANVNPVSGGGRPTGTVQFAIDGVNFGSPVTMSSSSNPTSMGISTLSVGNHTVSATYSGDGNFTGSSNTLSGGQSVVDGNNMQTFLGDNQTGATTRTLAQPFILQTTGNPIAGNSITFTVVPNNGAGGTFRGGLSSITLATDGNGYATSPQLIANGTPGSFTVTATDGYETVTFNVSTTQCLTSSVTHLGDSGTGTLRYAVDNACPGSTIDLTGLNGFNPLYSRIRIDDNLTITGPGASALTITGQNQTNIFFIGGGTVSISGVTLADGLGSGGAGGSGGSAAGMGGAIFMNGGAVNLTGVTFSGNSAVGTGAFPNGPLGGAGIGGAPNSSGSGGSGGDLFGMGGDYVFGGTGGAGGPGAGGGFSSGNGGFGGGGAAGGNGGFGGGGGGTNTYDNGIVNPGTGGYGAADGAANGGYGGASAGFGGAIFAYAGTLTLVNDTFTGNSAIGGISNTGNGQGKGGALFVYSGATAYNNGSTFSANTAADAGSPGIGNSAAPYVNGATCPSEDDTDICGTLAPQPAATLAVAVAAAGTFQQGSTAEWDVTVSNAAGSMATSAAVSMQDTLPAGYTVSSFGSTDMGTWSCSGSGTQTAICNATAQLSGGQSYPVIHLLVNVPATSPSSVTDNALAFGGGDPVHTNVSTAASGNSSVTVAQVAANIAVLAGATPQSATTGTQFAQPLTVLVTDAGGNPVPGVTVTFSAPSVGASATLSTSSPSDSNGHAGVTAMANNILGNYQVTAAISGTSASTTFALTNVYNGAPPPPSVCVVVPSNLTGWWKAENNFNDVTGAYNAAAGGNISFGNGEVGQAFSFDGTLNPYVTIPSGVFPYPASSAFSFETWFNTQQGGVIIGLQSGNATPYGTPSSYTPGIYIGTDGKLYAQMFYNQSVQQSVSSGVVNDGNWHHVAVTYDGSTQIAYLDGAQIGLLANFTESADGSAPYQFQLGTGFTNSGWPNANTGWYTFNGLIDEATVYARALSASEVQGIYYAGTYGKCDPAVSLSSPLSFGSVSEGGSATMSATLSNPGNAALAISAIALDGGDTNFSLLSGSAGDCAVGTPVAAGGSCNIRVSFAPVALGSLSGSVTVTDNSLYLGGTQTVQLQGTGTGTATQLQITQVAAGATAGVPVGNIVVQVEDAGGNVITGSTAAVTISSSPSGINGTLTVNAVNGMATFSNLVFYAANSYRLSVSSTGLTPASTTLVVSPSPAGTPTVVSVSPTPASGLTNTFVLTYSDTGGNASLKSLDVDFGPEVNTANSCLVSYSPANNVLYLLNDAGAVSSHITPGSGTLSNSQCSIAGSGTSVLRSGNTITLNLAVTASPTYTGVQSIIMSASDNSAANSGWLKEGTWQPAVNQPPTVVSVSPTPASGLTETFALTYSDPNGATNLNIMRVIFGATGSAANSCTVYYSAVANLVYLLNDAGTGSTNLTPGSGTLSNSQCGINGSGTSVTRSGDNLTLNLGVTASSTYSGSQNIYMYASDNSGANSGWVNKGTWTPGPSQPPAVVSVSPSPASGLTNTFALMYSDPNGAQDLKVVQAIFGSNSSAAYTCSIAYYPATNALYLVNDAGTGSTKITPGSGTLSNSQCSISGSGTTVVRSGNSLALNVAVAASATYTGVHSIFMYGANSSTNSGWVNEGTWSPAANQPPVVVSVSPSAAIGLSNTFALTYSDPNGAPDLNVVGVVLHATVSLANSCAVEYYPARNLLYLYNDAGSGTTSTTLGSGTLSNSQCTISGSGSSVARSGDTLTLNLAVTASSTYTGQQYIFLYAHDNSSATTGWTNKGTWAP